MPLVPGINYKLFYTGKNITSDVSETLTDLSYTDNTGDQADEVELTFDNKKKLWSNSWYPKKGDLINVEIGADGKLLNCGEFEIDETKSSGAPRVFKIKGLASAITKKLRTKNYKVHEGKSLDQIAQATCDAHGLTLDRGTHVVTVSKNVLRYLDEINTIRNTLFAGLELETTGEQIQVLQKLAPDVGRLVRELKAEDLVTQSKQVDEGFRWTSRHISNSGFKYYIDRLLFIENSLLPYKNDPAKKVLANDLGSIVMARETQTDETDLQYLSRIALDYGFTFQIKGKTMIFYMLSSLEGRPHSASFTPGDLSGWEVTNKTSGIFKKARVRHHDPDNQEIIEAEADATGSVDPDGNEQEESTTENTLEIKERVENKQQAEALASSSLHKNNKKACTASFEGAFNMQCVAGNNVKLYDIGEDSGIFQITATTFKLSKNGGNTFSSDAYRVAFVSQADKNLKN